jgi:hypothetical protein
MFDTFSWSISLRAVSVKPRQVCIAEVEEIVPVGSLSPEERQIFCFVRDAAKMVGF